MDANILLNCLKRRHCGRENAAKSRVLEARFDITGRELRDAVSRLRCSEHPVCSDEGGYYYAADENELSASIRQLSSRISRTAMAKNGLIRAMKLFADDSQMSIPL